jgi:hypothetical protein
MPQGINARITPTRPHGQLATPISPVHADSLGLEKRQQKPRLIGPLPSRSGDRYILISSFGSNVAAQPDTQAAPYKSPWIERGPIWCPLETPPRSSIDRSQLLRGPIGATETAWPRSRSWINPRRTGSGPARNSGSTPTTFSAMKEDPDQRRLQPS